MTDDDHRTTPGAGGAGHISGVGFAPFAGDAADPAMTIPEQAVEAAAVLKIIDDVCVLGAPPAAGDDYEKAMHEVGAEIAKRVAALPAVPQSLVGVQRPERETIARALLRLRKQPFCPRPADAGTNEDFYNTQTAFIEADAVLALFPVSVQRPEDVARVIAENAYFGGLTRWPDDFNEDEQKTLRNTAAAILALPHTGQPQEGDHERDSQVVKPIGQEKL